MAFAIYLHRDIFQPEDPLIFDKNVNDVNVNFTFVDFVPSVIKRSNTVIPQFEVEYHKFSSIMEVANEWLQRHGSVWEVVNCETVIFLYKYNDITNGYELRPNDCCFYVYGSEKNNVLKALRIWIRRRVDSVDNNRENGHMTPAQVLRYRDLKPEHKNGTESRFEDIDDLLNNFNEHMRTDGLDGRIITIESLAYEASHDWKIDTETSLSYFSSKNLFIVRIFYECGPLTRDQIGIQDFSPNLISKPTFFKRPTFETFDKVIERASQWFRHQPRFRFVNAQSIDIKMKSCNSIDSRQMAFTEHGDYIRIFRITYIEMEQPIHPQPVILSTRLFLPYNRTDTIVDIKQRLSDWINQYLDKYRSQQKRASLIDGEGDKNDYQPYPNILSAETVEVFAKDFRKDNVKDIEKAANIDTFLANRIGNKNAYIFMSLRIFLDGSKLSPNMNNTIDAAYSVTPTTSKRANILLKR